MSTKEMTDEQTIERARQENPDLEFDSEALVSRGDDPGAYVRAWVWVEFDYKDEGEDE